MTPSFSSLNLVLLGPPGSGTTSQAERLAGRYSIPCVTVSSLLCDEAAIGSVAGREVSASLEDGRPVADRVVGNLVLQRLDREDCARGFLLDGYPQNVDQAMLLDGWLAELGRSVERVVLLRVPADTPEVEAYFKRIRPVVDLYRSRGLLESIDGARPVDEIFNEILNLVGTAVAV